MSSRTKKIAILIGEGKHTIALTKLITLRNTIEKGSLEYGQTLNLLGSLYYCYGEFQISMEFYQSALELFDQLNLEDKKINVEYNIVLIYTQIQKYDNALELVEKILLYPKIKNRLKLKILLKKADIFHLLNKIEDARKLYDQLLAIPTDDLFNTQVLINSAINFSIINATKAKKQYAKAIELSEKMKQARLSLYAKMNYAIFLTDNNQEDEALDLLYECLEVTKENNAKVNIRDISFALAKIYDSKNQTKEAQKHRKLAKAIDSALEEERMNFIKHAS